MAALAKKLIGFFANVHTGYLPFTLLPYGLVICFETIVEKS
jgi:hypothetical protein